MTHFMRKNYMKLLFTTLLCPSTSQGIPRKPAPREDIVEPNIDEVALGFPIPFFNLINEETIWTILTSLWVFWPGTVKE